MKVGRTFALVTALLVACTGAYAENTTDALKAFSSLTGMNVTLEVMARTTDEYLNKVMAGDYLVEVSEETIAAKMALELSGLSAVTTKDIAVYAAAKQLPAAQVRNLYFRSLANVLRAEMMVNPASEEAFRNVQVILSLFLEDNNDNESRSSRAAIRKTITTEHAQTIADTYQLPEAFIEFILMDENWDDDDWKNDNNWQAGSDWNTDELFDDSLEDYISTDGIEGNSLDQNSLDNSVDDVSPDSLDGNSPDDSASVDGYSVDYASPASVDYTSPDYASPASVDYSSPDYQTPDYHSPEYNSPASVDYSSPASIDYGGSGSDDSYDS